MEYPSVAKNAPLTINESDFALAGCHVHESRIVTQENEVLLRYLDLAQVRPPDRRPIGWIEPVLDRDLVIFPGPVIRNGQRFLGHDLSPFLRN